VVARRLALASALILSVGFASAQEGWKRAEPEGDEKEADALMNEEVTQLSATDQKRYEDVALKLVLAINARDADAYRALFSDEGWDASIPWWRDMFAVQVENYGKIATAFAPARGFVQVGSLGFRGDLEGGVTFLVKFEEPMGGALTIILDESGEIFGTNVFMKQQLGLYDPENAVVLYELP
jgi:hypothetical protein